MHRSKVLLVSFLVMLFLIALSTQRCFVSAMDTSSITILPDGTVEPATNSILRSGNTYTLIGAITNSTLYIQAYNITLNGAYQTCYAEIKIESNYVTIENTTINSAGLGILIQGNYSTIRGNTFYHNLADISILGHHATVTDNKDTGGAYQTFYVDGGYGIIASNYLKGIYVGSSNNVISENTVEYFVKECENNTYINNIIGTYNMTTLIPTFQSTNSTASETTTASITDQPTNHILIIIAIAFAAVIAFTAIASIFKKHSHKVSNVC